jgi:signal peptidase I
MENEFRYWYGNPSDKKTYFYKSFSLNEILHGEPFCLLKHDSRMKDYSILFKPEQFIHKKSTKGVKIYDGDIITVDSRPYYNDEKYISTFLICISMNYRGFYIDYICISGYKCLTYLSNGNIDIIGNVHQNPELLIK